MENRKATLEDVGKTYIGRDTACMAFTIDKDNNIYCIRRGSAVAEEGKWSFPCGYLNYGESTEEAARREFQEETGSSLDDCKARLLMRFIDDNPQSNSRQDILFIYIYRVSDTGNMKTGVPDFDTRDEVTDIRWISFSDTDKYEWAFNSVTIINIIKKALNIK